MSTLYLVSGVPGAGKSTWIKNHITIDDVHVSRDRIRFSMLDDGDEYFAKEDEVFERFVHDVQMYLDRGKNVYADATHLGAPSRWKLINRLNLEGHDLIALNFLASLDKCLLRNEQREGLAYVPPSVIRRMYNQYVPASFLDKLNYKEIRNINA